MSKPTYDPINERARRAPTHAAAAAAEIVSAEAAKGVHSAFNACMYRYQCRANAAAAPAPRVRLTKTMLGQAWRESGALSASPPEWAIQFAQNIASAILHPQVDDRAACARMANDMRAEQTFLGSCRETCLQYDKARWDRLQRVIDYLDIAASTEPNAPPEHSAIYISKRLTDSDKDAAFVQAHINQAVSEAIEALPREAATVEPTQRYIVIGYGETDYPQAAFVNEREQLLDAVLGMMYTEASDADAEIREAYAKDLADEDEWTRDGIWRTEFEIGGIVIYDLGYGSAASNGEQEAQS